MLQCEARADNGAILDGSGQFPKGVPSYSHFIFSYQGSSCLYHYPHQGCGEDQVPDKKLDQVMLTLNFWYRKITSDITPEIQYVEVNHESCMNQYLIFVQDKDSIRRSYRFTVKLEERYS
jgi:hypothetical protein